MVIACLNEPGMPSQLHSVFSTIFLEKGDHISRYAFFGITGPAVQNGTPFFLDQERFFAFALGLNSYTHCLLVRICVLLPVIVRPIIFYLHLGRGFLMPATKENNEALETIYRRKSWMVMKARSLSYPYWVPRGRLAGEHGPKIVIPPRLASAMSEAVYQEESFKSSRVRNLSYTSWIPRDHLDRTEFSTY